MSFSSTITITGSTNITNFDIYECPTSGCTGCVAITGSTGENVSRTKLLTGHTVTVSQGFRYIKLVADTETCNNSICMEVIGIPTFTPSPTPTFTPTPTPTSTSTPTPTVTPGPTSTPTSTPTVTFTPTPTATATSTPTPTATATNTPTPTPTPTPTNPCPAPRAYTITNGGTFYWTDCEGNERMNTFSTDDEICICNNVDLPVSLDGGTGTLSGGGCECIPFGNTPTPTPTPLPPVAEFSVSYGSNSSTTPGSTGSTFNPTITVTNATALIKLSVTVQTGYQGDTSLTIPGVGSYSPTAAQGSGNTTFVEFTLGVGTYNCTWVVQAISDGSMTVATSTLTQVF